jgi:phosphoglycolate phosphatase
MNKHYDLIVFDWDGTVMDSAALIAETMQVACERVGMPTPPTDRARYVIGMGLVAAVNHVVPDLPPERFPQLIEHYRNHYLPREPLLKPFEGMEALLQALDESGYLLAVATGKPRVGLDRSLATTGLRRHFVATRCADEGHPKPHPHMLHHLMEVTGVTARRTLMIGDTSHDLLMAHNAGVDALAVTYGAQDRTFLKQHQARAYLDSVPELVSWLRANA